MARRPILAAVIAGLLVLLATAAAAGGVVSAGRGRAVAAADAAALAAAPVTFRPFGSDGSPAEEAQRFAVENGATLVRCGCPTDPSWSSRDRRGRGGGDDRDVRHPYRSGRFPGPNSTRSGCCRSPILAAVAANVTAATRALDAAGVEYQIHPYTLESDPGTAASSYGESVAARSESSLAGCSRRWWRWSTDAPAVAIVPVERPTRPEGACPRRRWEASRNGRTRRCGTSHRLCRWWDQPVRPTPQPPGRARLDCPDYESVYVSGGRRGLQIEVSPAVLIEPPQRFAGPDPEVRAVRRKATAPLLASGSL